MKAQESNVPSGPPPNPILLWSFFVPPVSHVGQGPSPLCLCTWLLWPFQTHPQRSLLLELSLTDPGLIWPLGSHGTTPWVYCEIP